MALRSRENKLDPIVGCFMPSCRNRVITQPKKQFFRVPSKAQDDWCVAVNRKLAKGALYICEDHLNIKEDLANYYSWKMKNITPRLKTRVPEQLKNISKRQSGTIIQLLPSQPGASTSTSDCLSVAVSTSVGVQVNAITKSVGVNTNIPDTNQESKIIYTSSDEHASGVCSTSEFFWSEDSASDQYKKRQQFVGREFILKLITNNPLNYLGLPKKFFWVIDYLHKELKIPKLHVIIVLYKIKNNDTFARISDLFQISVSTLNRLYYKVIKILSKFFNQFIYWPPQLVIKKNLPTCFRTNSDFINTQAIIDSFEIEIEKPKDPLKQSLTWSQYKNSNTIKYLISVTPDGLITFISKGVSGRISDLKLVEDSGFLEIIPINSVILADRGFKHLESILSRRSSKVLRPPSVLKDIKLTKAEVIQTKVLASLRVHVERVIRRLRIFKLLKPHSVVNNKLVSTLDDAVIIACGLINLQSPIIKSY